MRASSGQLMRFCSRATTDLEQVQAFSPSPT
jgi:hypothetical protein